MDKISNIDVFLRLINLVAGHMGGHPGVSLGESKVLQTHPASRPYLPILGGTKGFENALKFENDLKMLFLAFSTRFVPPKMGG